MVHVGGAKLLCRPKRGLHLALGDRVHALVVKEQPRAVALDEAHVVAVVRPVAHVHHHREQRVQRVRPARVRRGVAQLQLQGEHDAVHELAHPALGLDVLEALEVQDEAGGQLLDEHALLRLLQAAAVVAEKLVVAVQRLHRAEVAQAAGEAAVLVNLQAQVHEHLLPAGHCLALQAARLIHQPPLEDVMHPGVDGLCGRGQAACLGLILGLALQNLSGLVQQVVQELVRILVHVATE
mmetsp:Transcript_28856/g.73620  ORF Transcript_28856/g.73620 Transcript_28856/m.73620 type:complete len:238 (-) Transcript_28856:372-1085(-)